jgi:hypothetical protein
MRATPFVACAAIFAVLVITPAASADVVSWTAASGLYPDELAFRPYMLIDTAVNNPVLAGGFLTLSTDSRGESMFYETMECDVLMPELVIVDARVKYVLGTSVVGFRLPVQIAIGTDPNIGTQFAIGEGEILLNSSGSTVGPTASVPTSDGFHDYRIEVNRTTGVVEVYYDNALTLTGSVFGESPGFFRPHQFIFWGEASDFTFSTSQWQSFTHNAGAPLGSCPHDVVPELSSFVFSSLMAAVGLTALAVRRGRALQVRAAAKTEFNQWDDSSRIASKSRACTCMAGDSPRDGPI